MCAHNEGGANVSWMIEKWTSRMARVAVLVPTICLLAVTPATAETLKPTRVDDPAPGPCKSSDCSLREAVIAANQSIGKTTISLAKGKYKLQIPPDPSHEAKSGDLDVTGPISIKGRSAGKTRVSADENSRILQLQPGGRVIRPTYSLSNMTLRDGLAAGEDGGAVFTGFSTTKLKHLVIEKSTANRGGGLASTETNLKVTASTIRKNIASYGGGAFFPADFSATDAKISTSTISDNRAGVGGGISLDGQTSPGADEPPTVNVVNSTISGNTASNSGGGISALNGSTINLDNSTVAYNSASLQGSGGDGGGLVQASSSIFGFSDSILAANTVGSGGSNPQCSGTFPANGGANLIANLAGDACTMLGTIATDALIAPLAKKGGPTKTIALLPGSPALGLVSSCPKRDQRGKHRPPTGCDAGAFERKGP